MASNTDLNAGTGGDKVATKEITLDGDTAKVQVVEPRALSGTEGAYTANPVFFAEDAAHTSGDYGNMPLTVRTDTQAARAGTDGDYQPLISNSAGALYVTSSGVIPGTAATSLGKAEDAAHASGDTGVMALTVRANTAAATSGADGDYQPLITDTNGRLHVLDANSASALTALQLIDDPVFVDDAAYTVGTSKGSVVMGVVTSDAADAGDAAALAITASRSLKTVVTNSSGTVIDPQVDDAAFTPGSGLVSVIAGINTSDSVDAGDSGGLAMTLARALHVVMKTDTTGGTSIFRSLDIDETEEEIKASAGQVYWIQCTNVRTTPVYLKFYNATAASVTVGTTTPVLTFCVPSQGSANGAGFVLAIPQGIAFSTAITVAATTGVADNDTGAPGANEVVLNVGFA